MVEIDPEWVYDKSDYVILLVKKGVDMGHNRDKEKKEGKKKAQYNLREKRKMKKEKNQKVSVINLPSKHEGLTK
jgi:hypothetical protein